MYGHQYRYGPPGAGWRQQQHPPPSPLYFNPNDPHQNPNFYRQPSPGFIHHHQNPNFPMQNPRFPPNPGFHPHNSGSKPNESISRINDAVAKAHRDLIAAGETVSAWKVSESALLILQVDSWNSLGFLMQEIDGLNSLILTEGKINSFIHCFMGVRRITSLYELEKAICNNERISQFEELRLGPFLRLPLVLHYFSVNSDVTEVFKITTEAIVCFLSEFMDENGACGNKEFSVEDFLDFISRKKSVTKREMLGIRVRDLGMHISVIRQSKRTENKILSKYLPKSDKRRTKRPLFSMQKQQLDERFNEISQRVESFSSIQKDFSGQHFRFTFSGSEDEDNNGSRYGSEKNIDDSSSQLIFSPQSNRSSERASNCPYPSAIEEMTRLGLKGEVSGLATPSAGQKHNQEDCTFKRKRKLRNQSCTILPSPTPGKKVKVEVEASSLNKVSVNNSGEVKNGDEAKYEIANHSLRMFITTWKDACRCVSVTEVFNRMLEHYDVKLRRRKKVRSMFASYPLIGLINVAISSIRNGMWDSIYDALQIINQHEMSDDKLPEKQSLYECIDVGPSAQGALVVKCVPEHTHKTIKDEKKVEFFNLVQGNMSVTLYERKFAELSQFATNLINTKAKKIKRFIKGLNENIKCSVAWEEATTYEVALKFALIKEKSLLKPTSSSQNIVVTAKSKRKVPLGGAEPAQKRVRYTFPECPTCGKHHEGICRMNTFTCYKCGVQGHYTKKRTNPVNLEIITRDEAGDVVTELKPLGFELVPPTRAQPTQKRLHYTFPKCPTCSKHHEGLCWMNTFVCYKCRVQGHYAKGCTFPVNVEIITRDEVEDVVTGVSVEDIINKIENFFKFEQEIHNGRLLLENRIFFLKQLCSCEFWLAEQFSVKDFKSLGHEDLFTFLQKHAFMLPNELAKFLMPQNSERIPLEACMLPHQLVVLVSQACNHLSENEPISKQMICTLLTWQFPSISFKLTENGYLEDFMELVEQQKNSVLSRSVFFSVTLLAKCHVREAVVEDDILGATSVTTEVGHRVKAIQTVSSEDAIKVLVRAPMLLDLNLWSHWDILFTPALGPIVPWLQNEVNIENFLCMVTKEGKVIRIDHTATADSFLEAVLQRSSFQTAVKLLSVLALVGGEKHAPLSLLKQHANRAFEVILKNSIENMDVSDCMSQGREKVFCHQNMLEEAAAGNLSCKLKKGIDIMNEAVPLVSRFVIDCLDYLPAEFHYLATDILLSGMRAVVKDAASAILRECQKPEQRLMLHEIGLSLGVVEWIQDYHTISSSASSELFTDGSACLDDWRTMVNRSLQMKDLLSKHSAPQQNATFSVEENLCNEKMIVHSTNSTVEVFNNGNNSSSTSLATKSVENKDAAQIIQSIRHDEFGLDPDISNTETSMLRKQHARLGRALHCLSQELYSQDSHFLLELVQNADDNIYPENVEPTLAFIFEESGIIVLNNEEGFSGKNIRALCDVGNSTKKGSNAGYIGKKGIGFKSVFRVTDAPEIHSNGFHVKFDISEGQIGFVLPTIVPPCNVDLYRRLVSNAPDQPDRNLWNTCIVLPFKSRSSEGGTVIGNIVSMFSDLHPSLLLFLHRLQCIKLRNLLNDSLIVMRKEIVGSGIIKVSRGEEKMTWLVVSEKLRADVVNRDVKSTEISIAFTLREEDNGDYSPYLDQQPVFAFLPLRMYGLKFIIQGDFVLPSSREEVDGDSPWNQWLLSAFPGLFVSAVKSFCSLPCFERCPGKAISAYMSYIPLVGEVHGFFSSLPRLIIFKLRTSNCLLLEGKESEWVPPCKVLRGWNEQALILLPDNLLHEHLGLGFLDKNIVLSDSLARALGIEEYGPKILVQFVSYLGQKQNSLKSMGLFWLGSYLNVLHNMLIQSTGQSAFEVERNADLIKSLQKVQLIPLSDGSYSSIAEGTIWLHSDSSNSMVDGKHGLEAFPNLYAKIRIVCPAFLCLFSVDNSHMDSTSVVNISRMLHRIGVQRLSAHEIIKVHIIPAMSDELNLHRDKTLMTEYVCFVMTHLLSNCPECQLEKKFIVSELRNKALILTNYGFKRPVEVPIHFSKEYGNHIEARKFINVMEMNWHEVDVTYLKHPANNSLSCGLTNWRNFFQEIGITDFVQILEVNKSTADMPRTFMKNGMWDPELITPDSMVKDWESPELSHLLSQLSIHGNQESCKYLLEVLDTLWDDHFSDKAMGYCISKSGGTGEPFKSSFLSSICDAQWVVSNVDNKLHYPKDLYYDCDAVRSILGASAPYAVPKVRSAKFVCDIGFKNRVVLDDILDILKVWRTQISFKTSISQMCTFYTFLWNEMAASKHRILEEFHSGPFIFVPFVTGSRHEDVVSGVFLSPKEVYWHDPIVSIDKIKDVYLQCSSISPIIKTLCNIYPGLKNFFIDECGIHEYPPLCSYLQILKHLSTIALPSQASDIVLQVFLKWADGLKSGLLSPVDVAYLKECLRSSEFMVLPTEQDKWVSLHPSIGIVCCCDNKRLRKQFKNTSKINFVYIGEMSNENTEVLQTKLSHLLKALGVSLLSEIVTREAKYYGQADCSFKSSLMNWALPLAQRYVYCLHPDRYSKLKESGFDILSRLQIVVVEKLFFRNVIKNFGHASDEWIQCSCLLQDNILYTTQDSNSHSLFMEFSHFLFDGIPELHFANFLHMITTMVESGSTEEQTEFFILNTQKVTKLPEEEPIWCLSSVSPLVENQNLIQTYCDSTLPNDQGSSKAKKIIRNWPPVDWKTAPGFGYARENGFKTQPANLLHHRNPYTGNELEVVNNQTGNTVPISADVEWTVEDESSAMSAAAIVHGSGDNIGEPTNHGDLDLETVGPQSDSRNFLWRNQLRFGTPNPMQAMVTGRLGEQVAFQYFSEKFGDTVVDWVNENTETGLPFDIIIGDEESGREYIEVKSTRSARKDWFDISLREWQFAIEKGESFSIARVLLSANNAAKVSVFKNPVKLCQLSKLQLAIIMPRQQSEHSIVSS